MKNLVKKSTSKSKDTKPARGTRVSQSFVFGQRKSELLVVRKELGLSPPLAAEDRVDLARDAGLVSDAELEAIATMADDSGGVVAGIPIDTEKTREAIAYAAASLSFEHQLESLMLSCRDERLRRRAEVAIPALSARKTLRAFASTPLGRDVAREADHLRTLQKRGRRGKKVVEASTPSVAPSPATQPVSNDTIAGSG